MKYIKINFILIMTACLLFKNTLSIEDNLPPSLPNRSYTSSPGQPTMNCFACNFPAQYNSTDVTGKIHTFSCVNRSEDCLTHGFSTCMISTQGRILCGHNFTTVAYKPDWPENWHITCPLCNFQCSIDNQLCEKLNKQFNEEKNELTSIDTNELTSNEEAYSEFIRHKVIAALELTVFAAAAGCGLYTLFTRPKAKSTENNIRSTRLDALKSLINKHSKSALIGGTMGIGLFTALTLNKINLAQKFTDTGFSGLCRKISFLKQHSHRILPLVPSGKIINIGLSLISGIATGTIYKLFSQKHNKQPKPTT